MKCAILENRSTTTITESFCLCVFGRPTTKSRLTSSHGPSGTGRGVYRPALVCCFLAM
ncbi:hypothetical protein Hanom_Chr00s099113g01802951 [Helianthus anomalus]